MKIALALSATAFALLMTSVGAPTYAQDSDTLTVGPGTGFLDELNEGAAGSFFLIGGIPVVENGQSITGSQTIWLTEPGSTAISDVVTATIISSTDSTTGFLLSVKLTSDGTLPLTPAGTPFETIPETGAVQDFTNAFTGQFDLNNSLPTIQVTSDVSDVPEPSIWAMMLVGFGLLGVAGYRKTRKGHALAAG